MTDETREMDVQIVSITFDTTIKGQAKDYQGTEVVYRTEEGKVLTKGMATTVFKFNGQLETDLRALAPNDYAHVVMVKKGAFVNWQSAKKIAAPAKAEANSTMPIPGEPHHVPPSEVPSRQQVKSSYETPEERELRRALDREKFEYDKGPRQVTIVRQSCIGYALKLAELGLSAGNEFLPDEPAIIESAKVFEAYVLGTEEQEVNLPK